MTLHRNAAECVKCGEVIESTHVHDYRTHSCCPEIWFMVDGGLFYRRRGYKAGTQPGENYIDRSIENDEPRAAPLVDNSRWPY